jgi:predicted hydrocarbon binding protein
MKKVPDLVSEDSTEEILELSKSIVMRKMVDPVRNAMDLFEKNISRLIFLPDIPHIEYRTETVKLFFEALSREMKPSLYHDFLRKTGKTIGKSLGYSMMGFLINNNKLPKSDDVLTKLWNEWDMVAGWGKYKTEHTNDKITVTIEDSWLTRCAEKEKHNHCPFMEGYIHGFLWVVLKERYRWFRRSVSQPPEPPMEPSEIREERIEDNKCRFIVTLREESLKEAFDALSQAREFDREANHGQATNNIRISLDLALKQLVGLGKEERTSVVRIMKALKKANIQLRFKAIDEIYNCTSRILHGAKDSDQDTCSRIIEQWDDLLEDLEMVQIPDQEKIRQDILAS